VLYEERVERYPVRLRENAAEGLLGLLGRFRSNDAETVRDPVDMRVDGDRGQSVPEDEHAIRRFRADPRERGELLERRRDLTPEALEDLGGTGADRPRLRAIEPDVADQGFEGLRGRPRERRGVGELREESGARPVGHLVPGALRKDRPDQHLERIFGVVP
jgi:hypothetical protein